MITDIEEAILRKMLLDRIVGGRHTSADNIPKGFPKHMRGEARNGLKRLIREGFILAKPTSYGLEVSLNPRRLKEIEELIGEE